MLYKIRTFFTVCAMGVAICNGVVSVANGSSADDYPIATDSRIKTFVYSENEVFPIVLHYGYQTAIEFGQGESMQTYSVGNSYAWQFSPIGRTLFIKPLEENILTNMTVITNKRRYYFELQSKMMSNALDEELAYAVRFFYPDEVEDAIKPDTAAQTDDDDRSIPIIKPYNFNYLIAGSTKFGLSNVFDDGINTFFQFDNGAKFIPQITAQNKNESVKLEPKTVGNYLVVNYIGQKFQLDYNGASVVVTSK
ncbi:type IV secretion system protein VirB9 [Alphaproteobacteria bacterium]